MPDGWTLVQPAAAAPPPAADGWSLVTPASPTPPMPRPAGVVAPGASFSEKLGNAARMLGDVGVGVAKGVGDFAAGNLERAGTYGLIPGIPAVPHGLFGAEEDRNPTFRRLEEATTATDTPQKVGKVLEGIGEFALPTGAAGKAAVEAIPTVAKAGAKFQDVMGAARHIPVDITGPGNVALRISELAERGGSMPMAVNKFLRRVTDPDKAPMAYEEARDFASNISRLSANEFQRLTPVVAREVAGLRVALNKAVGEAAAKAGKGREYAEAMNEFAKAKRLHGMIDEVVGGAKKALPYGLGAGAVGAAGAGAYWLTKQIGSLLGGE